MIRKKSQASFEFMLTYGWVFILVLGVIAALLRYNIISSDLTSLKTETCKIYSSMNCLGAVWHNDGSLEMAIANDAQTQLQIHNITIKDKLNRFNLFWSWEPNNDAHYPCDPTKTNSGCTTSSGEYCGYIPKETTTIYEPGGPMVIVPELCTANLTKNSILKFTLTNTSPVDDINEFEGDIEITYTFLGSNLTTETHIAKGYIYTKKVD